MEALELGRETLEEFIEDRCMQLAAALSFYTVFSLPALLVLVLMLIGTVIPSARAESRLLAEVEQLMGRQAASQIQVMLEQAGRVDTGDPGVLVLGLGALVVGATADFVQLQGALNIIWDGADGEGRTGLAAIVTRRLISFTMILGLGFLLLVSLLLTTGVHAAAGWVGPMVPGWVSDPLVQLVPSVMTLILLPPVFAAVLVFLPDTRVHWRTVWVGAFVTTVLFEVGKFGLGFYLGRAQSANAYGAAGSLALVLIWIYYTSLVFFLGAEFTQVWSRRRERESGSS